MKTPQIEFQRAPFRLPPPSSKLAASFRAEFIGNFLDICGDTPLLWLPKNSETTISTDASLNGRAITYDASIASRKSVRGAGVAVDFNGTDVEADTPDVDALSFGDGQDDKPFSVVSLVKPDANDTPYVIAAKMNSSSIEEWLLQIGSNGYLQFVIVDESATANLAGTYETAVGTDWTLLVSTYDGSGSDTGIKNYINGVAVTTALASSGSYIAMENTAALVHIGAKYTTKESFFNGGMALVAVVSKRLTDHDNWAIKELVNGFHDLSL